jgi:hypothetical protein
VQQTIANRNLRKRSRRKTLIDRPQRKRRLGHHDRAFVDIDAVQLRTCLRRGSASLDQLIRAGQKKRRSAYGRVEHGVVGFSQRHHRDQVPGDGLRREMRTSTTAGLRGQQNLIHAAESERRNRVVAFDLGRRNRSGVMEQPEIATDKRVTSLVRT